MLSVENSTEKMPLLNKIRALKNKNQIIKIILVLTVLFVFYNIPIEYLGDTYPICLYKIILQQSCPGCGTTRAIWSILHLNINDALNYNRLIVIIFPLLAGCTIFWIFKNQKM